MRLVERIIDLGRHYSLTRLDVVSKPSAGRFFSPGARFERARLIAGSISQGCQIEFFETVSVFGR